MSTLAQASSLEQYSRDSITVSPPSHQKALIQRRGYNPIFTATVERRSVFEHPFHIEGGYTLAGRPTTQVDERSAMEYTISVQFKNTMVIDNSYLSSPLQLVHSPLEKCGLVVNFVDSSSSQAPATTLWKVVDIPQAFLRYRWRHLEPTMVSGPYYGYHYDQSSKSSTIPFTWLRIEKPDDAIITCTLHPPKSAMTRTAKKIADSWRSAFGPGSEQMGRANPDLERMYKLDIVVAGVPMSPLLRYDSEALYV